MATRVLFAVTASTMARLPQSLPKYCRYMTPLDISSGVGYINPVINDYHVDLHGFRDLVSLKLQQAGGN
jgi:hypothetical protein